jgi:hypothetical protein
MRIIKRILKRLLPPNWHSLSYNSAASHIVAAEIVEPAKGEIYRTLYPEVKKCR